MAGVATLALCALIGGCAPPPPQQGVQPWQSHTKVRHQAPVNVLQIAGQIDPTVTLGAATDGLRAALGAVDRKDAAGAMGIARGLPDIDKLIVEWMLIRRDVPGLSSAFITDFARQAPDWPSPQLMRKRAESAILREHANPADVIAAFGSVPPVSADGAVALARAYAAAGQPRDAGRVIGMFWRGEVLDAAADTAIMREFGQMVPPSDLVARWHMLMFGDHLRQADIVARRLGPDYVAMTLARSAVVDSAGNADERLAAVSPAMRADPVFAFTEVTRNRKANRPDLAARILLGMPATSMPAADADAWWVERRIVSRQLIEARDPASAYRVVAGQRGGSDRTIAEATFHCGWYALRFNNDPALAIGHFQALASLATKSGTRARAAYWLGRAYAAAGQNGAASAAYNRAAQEPSTFYGQLAYAALGRTALDLPPVPSVRDADRQVLARDVLGQVLTRLVAAGYTGDSTVLYTEVAKRATTSGAIAVLANMAEATDGSRAAMQIGIIGVQRGFATDRLAFPVNAIPQGARIDPVVERPLVFALSRQESNFDPGVVSSAGAVGLMQLMPQTASRVARGIGLPYSAARLTDPAYNATLGSAYLKSLLGDFAGSYIMTIASYNAGKSRVQEWVQRFGDPRDPRVDPVDWIESIPFTETRTYVQKVIENLEVYRARLNGTRLMITEDLRRGHG